MKYFRTINFVKHYEISRFNCSHSMLSFYFCFERRSKKRNGKHTYKIILILEFFFVHSFFIFVKSFYIFGTCDAHNSVINESNNNRQIYYFSSFFSSSSCFEVEKWSNNNNIWKRREKYVLIFFFFFSCVQPNMLYECEIS